MKAILCTKYGEPDVVLQLHEVEMPVPGDNQVLVKIYAASANTLDLQMKGGAARLLGGFRRPKDPRLGRDMAGRVEAVGKDVTEFKPGDEVFGVCAGAYAEYATTNSKNLALKPGHCSFEEAAAVPVAGITALQGLRDKGQVRPGQRVLIQGAGGGVGTFAVQIAKYYGAEVTAVCSTRNVEMERRIGADHVIDYTQEDFTRNGKRYDLIFAVNGYHSIFAYKRALTPHGVYVGVGGSLTQVFQGLALGPLMSKTGGQKMGFMGIAQINRKDLDFLKELMEAGKVAPVIDRVFPLRETGAALRYLGEKHARGKIVIAVAEDKTATA